ncbi:hypothetical protein THAOC_07772, partial [Thalassiosira oceanica]
RTEWPARPWTALGLRPTNSARPAARKGSDAGRLSAEPDQLNLDSEPVDGLPGNRNDWRNSYLMLIRYAYA